MYPAAVPEAQVFFLELSANVKIRRTCVTLEGQRAAAAPSYRYHFCRDCRLPAEHTTLATESNAAYVMRFPDSSAPPVPARFFGFVTVVVVCSVPALRLLHPPMAPPAAHGFTVEEIRDRAAPVLAQMAPQFREISVTESLGGGAGAPSEREWCVSGSAPNPAAGQETTVLAEACFDADAGGLVRASAVYVLNDEPFLPENRRRPPSITGLQAVQVARTWMPKLGLAEGGARPRVLFSPERSSQGIWQVWLQGQEAPNGPPLTVQFSVIAATGRMLSAVVVERAVEPRMYLPRRSAPREDVLSRA